MNFENYYILQELSIKQTKDVRFIAVADDRKQWEKKIQDIITAAKTSDVEKDIKFIITDPTGNFALYLEYENDGNQFVYSVREDGEEWLERGGLTEKDNKIGFYYDLNSKLFVITQMVGTSEPIQDTFEYNKLGKFLEDIFYMNRLCKARKGFAFIYSLYYYDSFSTNEADKIRNNVMAPHWFVYSLKDDQFRKKESSGIFGGFFR